VRKSERNQPGGTEDGAGARIFVLASLRRRLLSGAAWALAGKATNVVLGLAVSALLARLLSPSDMGAYFLAFSVVTVAAMTARMGLENAVVKVVAENLGRLHLTLARRALEPVYILTAVGGLLVGALLSFGVGPVLAAGAFESPSLARVVPLLGLWVLALAFQIVLAEIFRGLHDIRWATILGPTATTVLSALAFTILWVAVGRVGLPVVVVISAGAAGLTAIAAAILLQRRVRTLQGGPDRSVPIRVVFKESWPLLVTNAAAIVATQVDLWVVGAFRPDSEVAIYGAAARVVLLVSISLTIANQVLPPIIGELNAQGQVERLQKILRSAATIAGLPALAILAVFVFFGGPLLELVFGPHYRAGALVLAILSLGRCVGVYVGACEFTLIMTGNQRTIAVITAVTALVLAFGALAVVDRYGLVGVAIISSATVGVQQFVMLLATRSQTGIWTHAGPMVAYHALRGRAAPRPSS
jgi:O-antigen/teichoic acid export membrane protein